MHGLEIVSKLTHWRGVDMLKLDGFTKWKNCKIICNSILSLSVIFKYLILTLLLHVNYFHVVQNQYMPFWLLKDA